MLSTQWILKRYLSMDLKSQKQKALKAKKGK
jgi:hypothetical protein